MTPCEINTLLHIYVRVDDFNRTPAIADAISGFWRDGLIRDVEQSGDEAPQHGYALTLRGRAFVVALTNLPLPVEAWRMPGSDTVIL